MACARSEEDPAEVDRTRKSPGTMEKGATRSIQDRKPQGAVQNGTREWKDRVSRRRKRSAVEANQRQKEQQGRQTHNAMTAIAVPVIVARHKADRLLSRFHRVNTDAGAKSFTS